VGQEKEEEEEGKREEEKRRRKRRRKKRRRMFIELRAKEVFLGGPKKNWGPEKSFFCPIRSPFGN
jgi:hypothetical protein